jgi:TolB protein
MPKLKLLTIISLLICCQLAPAEQNIQIIGGTNAGNPKIAVVNFDGDVSGENNVSDIVASDLNVTGEFNVKRYTNLSAVESQAQYIVMGEVIKKNNDSANISYKLINAAESTAVMLNQNLTFKAQDIRKAAHSATNKVYQQLTNIPGIFTTKIAYIAQIGNQYQIVIADYDGYNPKILVSSNAPLTSLTWDNSGKQIAYVSFESGKPVVYVQDLYHARRYRVANFSGSNSSPAFTPTGAKLAVTLTKDDDGSHIYLIGNQDYKPDTAITRLINFGTIDTEAAIANNESIVFTSNHDGGPQIFMTDLRGATPTRLTVNLGNYNTTPRWAHDLTKITFINRNAGILKTYVMDLTTHAAFPVSLKTNLDISPSFAPNDKLVLFSSNNVMYIVNTTGTTETKLKTPPGSKIIDQHWANNF